MIVMPLGVGSATPTADRHLASVALWREGRVFLFDCGENAQMRLLQSGMKRSKIDFVLISHLDGDHFYGLPGLLSTMQLQRRDKPLHIIAPVGIKAFIDASLKASEIELCFDLVYTEIPLETEHMVVVDETDFFIEIRNLKHNKYCVGFRFQEKDKPGKVNAELATSLGITEDEQFKKLKSGEDVTLENGTVVKAADVVGAPVKGNIFAYVTDTEFCENCIRLAENATILYHEATFGQALKDKASETGHCTAQEAAIVAKTANAERLVIGHFSARYTNPFVLLKEAKQVFEETWVATELRPIMTDPAQEKNIFKPATKDSDSRQDSRRMDSRRPSPGGRRPSQGGGGFRPRQQGGGYNSGRPRYQSDRGGSRPYTPRDRNNSWDNRGGDPNRDTRRPVYNNRDRDVNRDRRDYPPRDREFIPRDSTNQRDREFTPRDSTTQRDREFAPRDRDFQPRERDYTNRDRDFNNRDRDYPNRDRDYNRDRRDYPPRDRDYNRPPVRTERDRPDNRQPRENDPNRSRNTGTNIPITPRTPFDEFDRF
jgi:ribonuclease Z